MEMCHILALWGRYSCCHILQIAVSFQWFGKIVIQTDQENKKKKKKADIQSNSFSAGQQYLEQLKWTKTILVHFPINLSPPIKNIFFLELIQKNTINPKYCLPGSCVCTEDHRWIEVKSHFQWTFIAIFFFNEYSIGQYPY